MKALAHIVREAGTPAPAFDQRLRSLTDELRDQAGERGVAVNAMLRVDEDPFGRRTPWRGTLEITGDGADVATLASLVAGLGKRLEDVADLGDSTLLVGEDVVFVPSERAPVRYQYLMRRSGRFDHDAYLARYRDEHSGFGVRTPGKLGYAQLHVDLEASRQAAGAAGVGVHDVDSVAQLHLASVDAFLSEVAHWSEGKDAIADEEVFVDRERSFDFCSHVDWAPGQ